MRSSYGNDTSVIWAYNMSEIKKMDPNNSTMFSKMLISLSCENLLLGAHSSLLVLSLLFSLPHKASTFGFF